ncbi:MAG: endonuclease/exonuclease/phosphatase family protein [Bacteroidetes bacterium]|nr:endonuclease/exonuclease/phosphatase family protein [Bacteroidota bacterium]MBL6943919.1 endonuclease/exonuclease/phosphatase family protein [Bacteroidales bacterium]
MCTFIKKLLKLIAWLLLIVFLVFAGFIVYITITDYQPEQVEVLVEEGTYPNVQKLQQDTFSLMNWNIGYAGLGQEMDFFYDGGEGVGPTKELSEKYLNSIVDFVVGNDSVDFWLLQEIDVKSKRTYRENQVNVLTNAKEGSYSVYAMNYKVPFVPVPVTNPMGLVEAGLMTFSNFPPAEALRYAYPLIAAWPDKLFLLDRCFILNRYPLENGSDLVIFNTHNSAYVYDSVLRIEELQIIKKVMLAEYNKGNYVIAGGDWNQNPPGYQPSGDYNTHKFFPSIVKMNFDFMPNGWTWAYDDSAPTNRQNDKPFIIGENGTTCLDYYLVSPNIEIIDVEVIDLKFEHSDHNPIYIKAHLKTESD